MESANCSTGETKFKADMCDENEMHDSGCEQSPTTQSPAYKCDHADSVGTSKCLTYNREFLLSLQFSTLSLNPDPQSLLWPDDIQYMTNNIFNANHSYYTPDEVTSRVERKEMMPDYFKPMLEGNESVLRPQRNSFQSGCKVRTTNAAETNEKSGGPVKGPGSHRRVSESKDRPRSVPNVDKEEVRVERRVGSGRIALERGSSKTDTRSQYIPDSRGSYPGREKPSKPASNAERTNNWRSRPEEEREVHHGREGGSNRLRTGRDGREHRGSTYYHQSHHDVEPEWFTEDVSTHDTIELKGFDGHQEKLEKQKKHKQRKKEARKGEMSAEEILQKRDGVTEGVTSCEEPSSNHLSTGSSVSDKDNIISDQILPKSATGDLVLPETGFSFDAWLSLPGLNEAGENTVKSVGSSRASRWFKTEDSCPPLTVSNVENSYNPLSYSPELANDVGVSDDHMTQLVQGILSVGGPSVSPIASTNKPCNEGSRLLSMLQNSATPKTNIDEHSNGKKKEDIQLPPVLTQLLSSSATRSSSNRPELPKEYKTVEELEASMQKPVSAEDMPTSKQFGGGSRTATHSTPQVVTDPEPMIKPKQEMTAFNKLVDLMKVTGELDKSIPKMPEVTNAQTPAQANKSHVPVDITQTNGMSGSPSPLPPGLTQHISRVQAASITQQSPISPALVSNTHPPLMQMKNGIPPNLAMSSSQANMAGLFSGPTFIHNAGVPMGIANTHNMNAPPSLLPASSVHPPPFQGSANPLLQQTIHQRQKLPSPIMFGTQPPVHIVAPAPIHPMGPNQFQQMMNPRLTSAAVNSGANLPPPNQVPEQPANNHVPTPKQNTTHSTAVPSMAFTPTSVIRKLANDKVDERHRGNASPLEPYNSVRDRAIHTPRDSSSHRMQLRHDMGLPSQQLQQQPMNMRPIVKKSSTTEQQLASRAMMEQQSERELRQQHIDLMNMSVRQQHANHMHMPIHQQHLHQPLQPLAQTSQQNHPYQHIGERNQSLHVPTFTSRGVDRSSPGVALQRQRAMMPAQHQQQVLNIRAGNVQDKVSPDIFSKWFCGTELVGQQVLPSIPNHTGMLHVEDIEN